MFKFVFLITFLISVISVFNPYFTLFFNEFGATLQTLITYSFDFVKFLVDVISIAFNFPFIRFIISFCFVLAFISFVFNFFGGSDN